MPSHVAEKRLIGMAEFPDSEYSDLDKINYASLMPPSVTRQAAEAPTAPYEKAPDSTSGLLSGNQAVPAMTSYNPTVPAMARSIAASDKVSPVFSQDYADYLEYLMTGRYPRG